ncbi:MAG TPA: hypothetical protein VKA26_11130 [Ignavibacteriaceae bacterium]|nr:hypothetical protein [Ignavibacteriaceae bacterium]
MQTFTYPVIFRLIYKYGNIPVTIILSLYAISLGVNLDKGLVYIIPFVVTFLVIYFLNRHYLLLYKILPYKIEADDEKMVCSEFIFYKKNVTIYFNDITSLEGGIYSGKLNGIMRIKDGANNRIVGFYDKMIDARKLETHILSKVKKQIYDDVVNRLGLNKTKPDEKKKSKK